VIEKDNKLIALVYPDYELVDMDKISESKLNELMKEYKNEINTTLAKYMQISKIKIWPEEFKKTPKQSIKRYLYDADSI
jgi:long-chain acyl-CoA synthetase